VQADEDEDEEDTDDEDSDDEEERERLEERLRREEAKASKVSLAELDEVARAAPHLASTAPPVEYQVVVPTYRRWQPVNMMTAKRRFKGNTTPFILAHTLAFLSTQRIPKKRVTLFVADEAEKQNYRRALKGSEWAGTRLVVSVLGNKNNRNFIFNHYKSGTYVVSIDDDVERISWKFREGITQNVLRILPPGGLETIIFDARQRMADKGAFLWGMNTSQNPRHMKPHGISVNLGLVNGYLNGFLCRPECPDLLRCLTDATEDSEFSVRHYAKDGVILRYRMYAGITSPYLNKGGLQTKFEKTGERITAEDRGAARKLEERWGANELCRLFPRLVGPPRPRADRKTMEVVFFPLGYPTGEGSKRKMLCPHLLDEDSIEYKPNPKQVGSHSHSLYEKYKVARTVAEARGLGARPIDFAFDSNWGYLTVTKLHTEPVSNECEVRAFGGAGSRVAQVDKGEGDLLKVRVKEMSEGCKGLSISRRSLACLARRCPSLRKVEDKQWAATDGPLISVPLAAVRVLLHWAQTGRLSYARRRTKVVHDALKVCGLKDMAKAVKRLEAQAAQAEARAASSASSSSTLAASRGRRKAITKGKRGRLGVRMALRKKPSASSRGAVQVASSRKRRRGAA